MNDDPMRLNSVDILALDLATRTGFCRGAPADAPAEIGSLRFGNADASNNAVFASALRWISKILEPEPRPTVLILEAMLPPTAKLGRTNADVRDRLAGLHGVVRAVAHLRGIYEIAEYSVGDIREHFLGDRMIKRDDAKAETLRRCQLLGWRAEDYDQADACALWSFGSSLIRPELALKLSPLFNKALRVNVQ